jgi:membrane-associated phospholipid phosphatase
MVDLQEIIDTFMENPLSGIGYYGPLILIFINVYFLYDRFFWCYIYVIFVIINSFLNKLLKNIIKEPRPKNWKAFASFEKLENEESYGMPSGHAQSVMFSVIFYYLIFGIDEVLLSMLFITGLTVFQRGYNKNHTYTQLFIGLIIGGLFAWFVYFIAKKYKNKILF